MKKYLYFTLFSVILITLNGCTTQCPTNTCKATPDKEKNLSDYWAFYNAKDPCEGGRTCSVEEKRAYTLLGYKAAKSRGLVPIDPKTGLTAIETPIKLHAKGAPYKCPEGTCSATVPCPTGSSQEVCAAQTLSTGPSLHSETGYLLTAFDTTVGPRFVLLKADEEFEPGVTFAEAAGTYESVGKEIAEGKGNIAVFLTAFPLVETDDRLTARLPNDFDVEHIKSVAEKHGKKGQILFRKWN